MGKIVKYSDGGQEVLQKYRLKDKKYQKFHRRFQKGQKTHYLTKSKAERQKWWADLTEQQKDEYLTEKQELKHQKNITKSIRLMEQKDLKFDCNQCFHHKTRSCIDVLPRGCEYFYIP